MIDDAGALADQARTHPVQRLQVELIRGLRGYELHRRSLHRLGDRLRITEVVLLSLRVGPHVLRRHQPRLVPKGFKLATEVVRSDAGLHADQARRHVGKPCLHLATRPFLTQHDCTTLIVPYDVERVLADIDANHSDCSVECLKHGVLLVFVAPSQLLTLAKGQEHGRTIPLCDIVLASRNARPALMLWFVHIADKLIDLSNEFCRWANGTNAMNSGPELLYFRCN